MNMHHNYKFVKHVADWKEKKNEKLSGCDLYYFNQRAPRVIDTCNGILFWYQNYFEMNPNCMIYKYIKNNLD